MQLLHCNPIPTAEFASLSLVLKNEEKGCSLSVTSPLSTLPASAVSDALQELQEYVNSVHEIMIPNTTNGESNTETAVDQCLVDDGAILGGEPVHVFRPSKGHGIALHYALVKERGVIQKCASILLNEGGGSASPKVSVEFLSGVLFCVGVSGVSYAHHSSTLISTITRRMRDFIGVLQGLESYSDPSECQTCIKSFLSASLLLDDEERKTNAMADTDAVTLISDMEGDSAPMEKLKSPIGAVRKNAKRGHSKRAALKGDSSDMKLTVTATSSADLARITVEKVAILSVSETESQLRKYEATGLQRRSSMASALGKTKAVRARRRKAGNEADLEGFDCPTLSPPKQKSPLSALQPPGLDTVSQLKPISPRNRPPRLSPTKPALPTLMAPRNDVGSRRTGLQSSRRWSNGESNVSRGPPPLIATRDVSSRGQAAFNAFAVESSVNDSFANGSFPNQQFAGVSDTKVSTNGTANHAAATSDERDPWGMIPAAATTEFNTAPSIVGEEEHQKPIRFEFSGPSDEGESALSPNSMGGRSRTHNDAVSSLQRLILAAERTEMNGLKDDDDTSRGSRHSAMSFQNGEWLQGMDEELRSAHSELDELVARVTPSEDGDGTTDDTEPRLMINLALNEDLTCSYRQSKMSSCSIEGVVQVQVACNRRDGVPFYLLVRDPSRHIRIVQENRRFSDSMAEELRLSDNPDDAGVDHKYTVSVPSADDYFPVLRYKCSSELRPVPIRVQTRVRVNEGASCRVALQISSNPANEDDLTDLTIVMGVPLEVKGETLVTTPAGGVWNAAKRSVIWCVAELGSGEKFQLQAEFEMNPGVAPLPPGTKPKFPVLVRCQCMYAQLSDVELEVSDISDVFPADVTMKMARRFRLSHRERS